MSVRHNIPDAGGLPRGGDGEFESLVRRSFDGELSQDESQRLQERLRESANNRLFYLDYAAVHSLLFQMLDDGVRSPSPAVTGAQETRRLMPSPHPDARRAARRRRTVFGAAGLVAVLGMILLLALPFSNHPEHERVHNAANVQDGKSPASRPVLAKLGHENAPGVLRELRAGDRVRPPSERMTVRFASGVLLALSDDADLEIVSDSQVRLYAGQIQADVGESGRGFQVLTESADVVDLGTVFGVGVSRSGETDVVVFNGEVEVGRRTDAHPPRLSETNLYSGEAVRVRANGERARILMIWQDAVAAGWSTERVSQQTSLIASVRDNLSSAARPLFYGIVPGGFRERAKAFVDRPYVWSGSDSTGLPEELIGSDYIQTFNDDKFQPDLEIVLTLARAADVYVLIDKRHPVPDWLDAEFVNSVRDVRLDREEHGPVVIAVWKRTVRDVREIRLGPVRKSPDPHGGAMYGVVVAPAAVAD